MTLRVNRPFRALQPHLQQARPHPNEDGNLQAQCADCGYAQLIVGPCDDGTTVLRCSRCGFRYGYQKTLVALSLTVADLLRNDLPSRAAPPSLPARLPTVCLTEVTLQKIEWLWPGYIPYGMVTLIEGDPGLGKGTLSAELAARLSTGRPMPLLELPGDPQATLLLTTAEDDLSRTIAPRLHAAGADVSRIHAIEEIITLPDHIEPLEEAIRRLQARLVIIDPLNTYLSGRVDSHKDQDIRRVLSPLKFVAEGTGAAIVLIIHLNKMTSVGSALYRGGGSIAIPGVARSVLMVGKHPQEEDVRVLAPVKGNLCERPPSLAFTIESTTVTLPTGDRLNMPCIQWHGVTECAADDLLAAPRKTEETPSKLEAAKEFYRRILADGAERRSSQVETEREAESITAKTAQRARRELGLKTRKEGFGEEAVWYMSLPVADECTKESQETPKAAKNLETETLAAFGTDGDLLYACLPLEEEEPEPKIPGAFAH